MTSLDDAYSRSPRDSLSGRVLAGAVLLTVGALAIVAAIGLVWLGTTNTTTKLWAGITAGLGIPAMLAGVVVVLPASFRQRLGVAIGTALATVGIWLFRYAYPDRWTRTANPIAFETLLVYGLGCAIALWFVFGAIATTRLRNNPQGTVSLEIIQEGETKTIEVDRSEYRNLVSDGGDATEYLDELEEE